MANPRLTETATEADWSFLEHRGLIKACQWAGSKLAANFDGVDPEDGVQEAYLTLAVRPETQRKAIEAGRSPSSLGSELYKRMSEPLIARQGKGISHVALDEVADFASGWGQ